MSVRSDSRMQRCRSIEVSVLISSCALALSGCFPTFSTDSSPRLDVLTHLRILSVLGLLALFATAVASVLIHRALRNGRQREEDLALTNTVLTLQQQSSPDDIIAVDRRNAVIFRNRRYADLWEQADSAPSSAQAPFHQVVQPSRVDRGNAVIFRNRRYADLWEETGSAPSSADVPFHQVIQPLLDKVANPQQFLELVRYVAEHPGERKREQVSLRDGRVLEAYSAPTRGRDGSYLGRVWYLRDVTGRMEAQRALEESEAKFRGLVKAAADAMVIVNASQEIVMANEQFDSLFGYDHGEVIGKNLEILVPPRFTRHSEYVRDFIKNPRKRLMGHGLELVALRKDRSEFPVEIGLSPLETTQGMVVSAAIRDISARQATERQLAAAAAYARSLLEASPDPIFTVSPDGIISDVNEATVRLSGLSREALVGSAFSGHFSDPERAAWACREVFSSGFIRDCPLTFADRSGGVTDILFNATLYRDKGGGVEGMFATARDMRDRHRVEAELRELNRSLEERVAQRSQELLTRSREIVQAAETIGAISGELSTATSQVLASAVQTAASVSETTVTVEEVKQTALLANETARSVTLGAQKTLRVAQEGKQAMQASNEGMLRIRDQVASGVESMVRLRRQSKAIADIIASVNDLADQSNLLAVNAAIEASKAGQQGRGFAVVAQEVKNLAEQSKRATARVGAILNEIKAATDHAVLLAEQGVQAVRDGIEEAAVAEDAIVQMEGSMEMSTQAALQIAASCQQQLAGMAQVAHAMESIKEASVHNIHGMREVEATLQHLRELGEKLKQLDSQLESSER